MFFQFPKKVIGNKIRTIYSKLFGWISGYGGTITIDSIEITEYILQAITSTEYIDQDISSNEYITQVISSTDSI